MELDSKVQAKGDATTEEEKRRVSEFIMHETLPKVGRFVAGFRLQLGR